MDAVRKAETQPVSESPVVTLHQLIAALAKVKPETAPELRNQVQAKRLGGIPVINKAPAGPVVDYEEYGTDSTQGYEYIDRGGIEDPAAFAVVVTGDSMEPTIGEGDRLVFSPMTVPVPRATLENGKVVFVRFAPESRLEGCTIARYHLNDDGAVVLAKDNPRYSPMICRPADIQQISVAVERRTSEI